MTVICAIPLSGQYETLQRAVFYVCIALCMIGRKNQRLRDACLGPSLLSATVSSVHAIVLAANRVEGVVNLDNWGAFQITVIGLLAAPTMVRYSNTYFHLPGRNLIFVSTVLNLAGSLSLSYSFYNAKAFDCFSEGIDPILDFSLDSLNSTNATTTCTMWLASLPLSCKSGGGGKCTLTVAPARGLTLENAKFLSASSSFLAILYLLFMWWKVANWSQTRYGFGKELNEERHRMLRNRAEVELIFSKAYNMSERAFIGACLIIIVVLGEMNFSSRQMKVGTEAMASVGASFLPERTNEVSHRY
ncbi:hypothetical protein BT69DRAFT_626296 [Atractiella rhizophila]|nr:hypothetical protein BT69DRAFT_626296 [Atractiella rhizophila]